MAGRKPPSNILEEFRSLFEAGASNKELMERFSISERIMRYYKQYFRELNQPYEPSFPQPSGKSYEDFITIESDKVIVIGDAEIPYHDPEIFTLAFKLAQNFNIKTLIINGDFVALDCFSNWAKTTVYKLTFEDELDPATEVIFEFLKQFEHIVWVTGNHEKRLIYRVDGNFTMEIFFKKMANVQLSEYSHCILKSGGKEIRINHQKNYGRNSTGVVKKLANVYLMNIIGGHTHHQSFSYHESGKYFCVDGGHCRSVKHTRYKNIDTTTHPSWNPGFTMIIDGYPYLINKDNASFWLNISGGDMSPPREKD